MTYRNVVAAVVRALAAETINSAGGCDFEPKVQCAKQKGEIVGKEAAFLVDCMVHARLRAQLAPDHWNALVAQYSTHAERKHAAIILIAKAIRSPAPERFRHAAVVTWAMPKLPGQESKRSTSVLPAGWYSMDNWLDDPVPERTQYRWKSAICKDLRRRVDEALSEAQGILDGEGLIAQNAA
ncbi:hypothetical protein CJF39_05890 [Pseudomonas lundensis]|uniref:Phage-like protein n=1 Tax=Pseudomonas lundensis TaxID=86185 RepID=A0A266ND37_9PSED|nr:hypothetical protein [Pseudomonas lundensis]OZY60411.1 hypothetical protein CJF39_05890 [Pseudomonas lundensis]